MGIKLSDHFTYRKLIRFTVPSVAMMWFTSIYTVVDGYFISNYAGKTAFAAVNLVIPLPYILVTLGFMLGAGGSAVVSKTLGQGRREDANRYFSMIIYSAAAFGIISTVVGLICLKPLALFMGADAEMLKYCMTYGRIFLAFMTLFTVQCVFQNFMVTAERPGLGFAVTLAAGIVNMVLDFILVGLLGLGVAGAATATGISMTVGAVIPLMFFIKNNNSLLRLVRTGIEFNLLKNACINGSSELMSNAALSIICGLYNLQLMKYIGPNGVAAFGVIMYVEFMFSGIFYGYAMGSAPVIGFHYGAQNKGELRNLFRKSLKLMGGSGLILMIIGISAAGLIAGIYVGYDAGLADLTTHGFRIYSMAFLIMGINIFGSAFFTALNNGLISAAISFLRTLVFQTAAVMIMPLIFGTEGIWYSVIFAETMALILTTVFFITKQKNYGY